MVALSVVLYSSRSVEGKVGSNDVVIDCLGVSGNPCCVPAGDKHLVSPVTPASSLALSVSPCSESCSMCRLIVKKCLMCCPSAMRDVRSIGVTGRRDAMNSLQKQGQSYQLHHSTFLHHCTSWLGQSGTSVKPEWRAKANEGLRRPLV